MSLTISEANTNQWREQRMSFIMITDVNAEELWRDVLGHIKLPQDQIVVISPLASIDHWQIPEVLVYPSLNVLEEEVRCRQKNLQYYSQFPKLFAVVDSSIFISPESLRPIEKQINTGLTQSICNTLIYNGRHLCITLVLLVDRIPIILTEDLRMNLDLHFFTTNYFKYTQRWWETMIFPDHQEWSRKLPSDTIYVYWIESTSDFPLYIVQPCTLVNHGPFWDLAKKMSWRISWTIQKNDKLETSKPLTPFEQTTEIQIYLNKTLKMMVPKKTEKSPMFDMKMICESKFLIPFFMRIPKNQPKNQSLSSDVDDSLSIS